METRVPTSAGEWEVLMLAFHRLVGLIVWPALLIAWPTAAASEIAPPRLPPTAPEHVGFRTDRLIAIQSVVDEGLEAHCMPGCVIAFGRQGKLAWLKAYGHRQLQPEPLPMTTDTVFDMASLTKPVATATCVMMLMEQGKLRLGDSVANYIPDFAHGAKKEITLTHLLTHHSGLIADNPLSDYEQSVDESWRRVLQLEPSVTPGTRFVYSDVGFVVLGHVIQQVSGQDIHQFSQQQLFLPLGMKETGYLPGARLRARAAPTQQRDGNWIQGEVHDPRAFLLGGVAGHAGLFSTAEDLAVYAQMMLRQGAYCGVRILSPPSVELMTRAHDVSGSLRGLGWDKLSGYSSNRAENFSAQAFGHGGFTGTVLWIDPALDLFFIFLSNRVHPDGTGNVNSLAGRIATIVASAIDPQIAVAGDEH
jgi:CubicO group peptidase (beta-lactamase class C family)